MLVALFWSKSRGKKAVLMSESKQDDAPRSRYKELFKKFIVSFYDAAIVGGQPHQRYLESLDMPKDSIFFGYDVVNNNDFDRDKIRHLPRPIKFPFFLAINRFIPKKNLIFLLSAYAQYLQQVNQTSAWHLVLCGDGEMRSQIEQKIFELGIQDQVHLTGFLQQAELLPYFAHAKCFVHTSTTEQWGLVVNEAMAAGLPVLVSNRCGCYEDLLIEGINGFGFDPEDLAELTNLMLKMSAEYIDLEEMGNAALMHIQNFSPNYFAQGVQDAIAFVSNKS
ncbi:MAG: glycosyltransferase family 4 protein [Pseudanabaenaceae cyanobacterium bins.39]|nr:glycosyltransferase family 4 protein [Pseudanabaenaceae cyanobacterium bins.39]